MNTPLPPGSRLFALVARRAEILVVRNQNGLHELPEDVVNSNESARDVLTRIAAALSGCDHCSVGARIELETSSGTASCFPIWTKRSAFENWAATQSGLVWLAKSEIQQKPEICGEALAALRLKFPDDAGNSYAMGETPQGTPTFFHLETGETLHGQVGPWQEAQQLYLPLSGLRKRSGRAVIHDLGLGCGTLALAALDAFLKNPQLNPIEILSYDLEIKGITALLAHIDRFPFALPFRNTLEKLVRDQHATLTAPDGRTALWRFLPGDFMETSQRPLSGAEKGDVIFLDFFSPKSHPWLWTCEIMINIFNNSSEDAILITSSSATSTRAALAAAGFFVGLAPASGKRSCSTVAAKRLCDLDSPLPQRWLQTFLKSHVPFCSAENSTSQERIRRQMQIHPQFSDVR